MATEIERKFLVHADIWACVEKPQGKYYRQGYLYIAEDRVVRVRMAGDKGFITIKGGGKSISRDEYEYEIPYADAEEMFDKFAPPGTEKVRYRIPAGNLTWEVDEFLGANAGLIVAEIELEYEDQTFDQPAWVAEEVSEDSRYTNAALAVHPYNKWG